MPPGFDEENPYEGDNLSEYPDWWERNVREHRQFDLRPYRPARFSDGGVVPATLRALEDRYGIDIQLYAVDPEVGADWVLAVDGRPRTALPRERLGDGYTELGSTRKLSFAWSVKR